MANYVTAAWSAWLATEEQRVRRTINPRTGKPRGSCPSTRESRARGVPSEFGQRVEPEAGVLMLNFVAIDFETANSYRGSPCAVGLVRVRNGVPVAERRWLMRPPEEVDHFDWIQHYGFTASPRTWWRTNLAGNNVLPKIVDFIGDDVVVAHNAGFDIGVIRYACAVDNIEWPAMRFLCTMVLARRALSLPSYRLPFVLDALGGSSKTTMILSRTLVRWWILFVDSRPEGVESLDALADSVGVCIGRMTSGIYLGSVATSGSGSRLVRPELNPRCGP